MFLLLLYRVILDLLSNLEAAMMSPQNPFFLLVLRCCFK